MRLVGLGHNDKTAGVFVQTMNDSGAHIPACFREPAEPMQKRVDQRAAIAGVVFARTRVDDHSGGLIQHHQTVVFIHDVERDLLRKCLERRTVYRSRDGDFLAAPDSERGLSGAAVDQDLVLFDELLDADSACIRKLGDQPLVEPPSGGFAGNYQDFG